PSRERVRVRGENSATAHLPIPLLSTLYFLAQLGPARVRDEDLSGKGDRVRPPAPGARQHLDHATVHASRRARACGGAGSRGIMADGYSAMPREVPWNLTTSGPIPQDEAI